MTRPHLIASLFSYYVCFDELYVMMNIHVAAAPAAPAEGTEDDKQESDTKGLRRTQRKRAPPPPPFSTPSSIEVKSLFLEAQAPAAPEGGTEDVKQESNSKTPRRTQRKRAPPAPPVSTPNSSDGKKMQKNSKGSAKTKRPTRQRGKESAPPPAETEDTNSGLDLSFLDNETGRAEFDNYLSSLDEILAQPFSEEPFSHPVEMQNSFAEDSEMAEARRKLSSLLDMDFPSLICFKDLEELASLASKLRKDPTLTAEQLVKLKLIEEIPSFCEVFLENREVMEQADKFFRGLDDNRAKVSSLKQEYSELKQQVTNLESEVDSNTMTVQDIDNQIAQLKAHRAELTKLIDKKKRDKDELTYNQKLVANSIPKVVHEVQLANAKKPEWELKKENALKREGEILAKFAPLKGFSL
ncbi:Spindle assembly abnormal 6 [Gossypium australe]|uniref:Spindle assembly abnormal 6 n=1 Tax=Gossypium australe TaxID=47621 RepID=A0A5B6U9B8_9ROSI|nr:Spindle assembly abnormal 6 [Gossypium australe]